MTFFIIRHKETKEIMPLMRRGRGYTHWNPAVKDKVVKAEKTGLPRLFKNRKLAEMSMRLWAQMPNSRTGGYSPHDGEWIDDVISTNDGRKEDNLEILQVQLSIIGEDLLLGVDWGKEESFSVGEK